MKLLGKVIGIASGLFQREQSAKAPSSYQLWLEDLGNNSDAVVNFLINDMIIAGLMEKPEDIPELPWEIIELPVGSDSFGIIQIKADELEKLGAVVTVREV